MVGVSLAADLNVRAGNAVRKLFFFFLLSLSYLITIRSYSFCLVYMYSGGQGGWRCGRSWRSRHMGIGYRIIMYRLNPEKILVIAHKVTSILQISQVETVNFLEKEQENSSPESCRVDDSRPARGCADAPRPRDRPSSACHHDGLGRGGCQREGFADHCSAIVLPRLALRPMMMIMGAFAFSSRSSTRGPHRMTLRPRTVMVKKD